MYQIIYDIKPEIYKQMKEAVATLKQKKIYKTEAKFKINLKENIVREILDFETEEHTSKEKKSTFVHVREKGNIISAISDSMNSNNNKNSIKVHVTNTSSNSGTKK